MAKASIGYINFYVFFIVFVSITHLYGPDKTALVGRAQLPRLAGIPLSGPKFLKPENSLNSE